MNKLILSGLTIKSTPWAHKLFDKIVENLELVDVKERYTGGSNREVEDDENEEVEDKEGKIRESVLEGSDDSHGSGNAESLSPLTVQQNQMNQAIFTSLADTKASR